MRSLFGKVFGLCVLVLLISFLLTTYFRLFTLSADKPHEDAFATMMTVELEEARHAWETGGQVALAETMGRLKRATRSSEATFTDAKGIDLESGRERSELVQAALHRSPFSFSGGAPHSFARVSPDHRYWYFLRDSESLFIPQARRQQLTALLIAAFPCYFLSWWLALPLLRLRRTMHSFGKGNLEARADARRRDDFGDLARTFNAMAEQIQTLLGTERRLLREVSHELRSPLTRLQVAVEIARSRQSDQYLEQIEDEAKRLENLIDELLDLARAENSAGENQRELVRLDLLTQRIVNSCDIEAQARGCVLELSSVDGATVSGARELLRRAIENVVRNAIRFAPPRSTVEARVDIHNGTVRITVRDLGPGVADEALIRLFDPFYREPSGRVNEAGLGLGLAIAKRAVELHGGRIEASNARPGLRVQISLPVVQGSESKAHAPMLSAS